MVTLVLLRIIVVVLLVAANAFFVAAEFAMVSLRDTRIQQLIEQGRIGARTVRRIQQRLDVFLPAVQLGVTLASLQGNQGMKGSEDVLKQHMKAQGLTFAQVAENRGRKRELVGTPEMVADRLQEIFESGACDGFVVSPINHPGMFEQFCRSVVPELQRRGLFRKDYTGRTLRENLRG